jgi:hypothetical protein
VPRLDPDLLGLVVESSAITVNASAHTGDGVLLGNVLTVALNTLDATPGNLTGLSNNLNALLAKVVGVLNATSLVLPADPLAGLRSVLQTLALPKLISPTPGATSEILNLAIASTATVGAPVQVDLLGLDITTSNIHARLLARTGEGQLLGNLL